MSFTQPLRGCRCSSGDQNFKTIMSYDCNEVGGPSGVLTIPVFSNPDYKWNGMPAGIAATNDCARRLAETRTLVAAARLTRVILSQPSRIATALAPTQCIDAATYNNGEQVRPWTGASTSTSPARSRPGCLLWHSQTLILYSIFSSRGVQRLCSLAWDVGWFSCTIAPCTIAP